MSQSTQFSLLRQRRFLPFFLTQCLGALNDNVLRYGLIFLVTRELLVFGDMPPDVVVNLSAALFILPFFLFSAFSGQLADKFDKAFLIRRIKVFELLLMLVAWWGLTIESSALLLSVLFMTGLQSTLFGPVKYAILPQVLRDEELIGGNALVEGATYVAIIAGMVIGGASIAGQHVGHQTLAYCLIAFSVLGVVTAWMIPPTAAADPHLDVRFQPLRQTAEIIGYARRERSVFLSILGISWFWAFGLVAMSQLPGYANDVLRAETVVSVGVLLPVTFAIGVGFGSLLCEKLSGRQIELGLVPLGSIGLSWFALDLFLAQPFPVSEPVVSLADFASRPQLWRVAFDLTMLGVSGGIYSVPLYAMMQQRSPAQQRSRIIAANNILNAVFMVSAAAFATVFAALHATIPQIFLILALMNVVVAVYIYALLPEFLMRFLTWLLIHVLYRVRTSDFENIPQEGPAVLVCNHVSFVDALLIGGSVRRPVRFVMYYKIFRIPILSFLFRTAKAIPIASSREDPKLLDAAFERIDEELAAGNLVCIFPEGAITADGNIANFRPGIERIIEKRPVPVVPLALCGLWGSWFSRKDGGAVMKLPRRIRARVKLTAGPPVPAEQATAALLEQKVRELRGEYR